jgi:hypothetical protein
MRPAAWDAWVAKARSVRIEDECSRRGIVFNGQAGKTERCGPCPKCGGGDRFAVNTKKQVFNCRGCGARGRRNRIPHNLTAANRVLELRRNLLGE